jgi:hypothetical protein
MPRREDGENSKKGGMKVFDWYTWLVAVTGIFIFVGSCIFLIFTVSKGRPRLFRFLMVEFIVLCLSLFFIPYRRLEQIGEILDSIMLICWTPFGYVHCYPINQEHVHSLLMYFVFHFSMIQVVVVLFLLGWSRFLSVFDRFFKYLTLSKK